MNRLLWKWSTFVLSTDTRVTTCGHIPLGSDHRPSKIDFVWNVGQCPVADYYEMFSFIRWTRLIGSDHKPLRINYLRSQAIRHGHDPLTWPQVTLVCLDPHLSDKDIIYSHYFNETLWFRILLLDTSFRSHNSYSHVYTVPPTILNMWRRTRVSLT